MFFDGVVPLVGYDKAMIWPSKLNLIYKNYHGQQFEGNACKKLLNNPDILYNAEICGDVGQLRMTPFVAAFKAMNKIADNFFTVRRNGNEALQPLIEELKHAFLSTGISQTLKIHVLLDHLDDVLNILKSEEGLGLWSEQAGESIHRQFLKIWEKYAVNRIDNPSYGSQLKKAVVELSSMNI